MENIELEKSTEGQENYEDKRKELFAWLKEEGKKGNSHVPSIDRELISPELVELFSKFRKRELTAEEFIDTKTLYFSSSAWESLTREQKDTNNYFLAMIANKLNSPEDTLERLKKGSRG